MARRTVLTSRRQRSALFALPQREADLLRHYTLSDEDLQNIGARRQPRNKLGFALQLCVLRHPGRLLAPGEFVPPAVVGFIGRQLDLDGDELADYAVRSETRHEHLAELRRLYGFRSFSGGAARELVERLRDEAEQAQSNEDLARRFVEACRDTRTILPATTTIERICADALVDAERRIEARIAERVPPGLRRDLEHLLEETADAGVTRCRAAIPPPPTGCWITASRASPASRAPINSLPSSADARSASQTADGCGSPAAFAASVLSAPRVAPGAGGGVRRGASRRSGGGSVVFLALHRSVSAAHPSLDDERQISEGWPDRSGIALPFRTRTARENHETDSADCRPNNARRRTR